MVTVRSTGWLAATVSVLVSAFPAAPALAVTDAERMAVYRNSARNTTRRQYAAAKPLAERLVKLTEEQYGAEELPLTNPLTNLATVDLQARQLRGGDRELPANACASCRPSRRMADKAQIRPLHGLGVSFMGANDPESAVVALKRAADLSRNTDGLFNINQVEFIDALIDAYEATGRYRRSRKGKPVRDARRGSRLRPQLDQAARPPRQARALVRGRAPLHQRAQHLRARAGHSRQSAHRKTICGASARCAESRAPSGSKRSTASKARTPAAHSTPAAAGAPVFAEGTQQRRGESYADHCARRHRCQCSPMNLQLRGEVLADLGDWYLVTNALRRAYDTYAEAWKAFAEVPTPLAISPSRACSPTGRRSARSDRSQLDPAEAVIKQVEMHFTVDRDGRIEDVTSPTTDVPETIVRNSTTVDETLALRAAHRERRRGGHARRGVYRKGAGQRASTPAPTEHGAAICWGDGDSEGSGGEAGAGAAPETETEEAGAGEEVDAVCATGASLIGTVSMLISATAAAASGDPGNRLDSRCNACDASSGFAMSSAGNCVRNFAAASRMAAKAAIPSSSSPLPILGAGPLPYPVSVSVSTSSPLGAKDDDLVADGDRAVHAAGFPRARERELLDARLENGHAGRARVAPRRRCRTCRASVNSASKICSTRCLCDSPSCAS